MLHIHGWGGTAEAYIMLHKWTLEEIEQMAVTKLGWENDMNTRLGGGIRMQAEHVMMIPWMKIMAVEYHDRSKIEKNKAMGKQHKEMQTLFAMTGKWQWAISTPMRGDIATPLAVLRRKVRGPSGQPPGTVTTDLKEVGGLIRETYGEIYAGNVKEGRAKKMVDDYMGKYTKYIYKRNED